MNDEREPDSVLRRHTGWAERKNWIDPRRIFLLYTFLIVPVAEAELKQIVRGENAECEEALAVWAKRWNLDMPWCREMAPIILANPWDSAALPQTFSLRGDAGCDH